MGPMEAFPWDEVVVQGKLFFSSSFSGVNLERKNG